MATLVRQAIEWSQVSQGDIPPYDKRVLVRDEVDNLCVGVLSRTDAEGHLWKLIEPFCDRKVGESEFAAIRVSRQIEYWSAADRRPPTQESLHESG